MFVWPEITCEIKTHPVVELLADCLVKLSVRDTEYEQLHQDLLSMGTMLAAEVAVAVSLRKDADPTALPSSERPGASARRSGWKKWAASQQKSVRLGMLEMLFQTV